jgi:hypothetical protein
MGILEAQWTNPLRRSKQGIMEFLAEKTLL